MFDQMLKRMCVCEMIALDEDDVNAMKIVDECMDVCIL